MLGFVAVVLGGGTLVRRSEPGRSGRCWPPPLAGCVAFFLAAAVDWTWQMPALPVAALMLAAALVMATPSASTALALLRRLPLRIAFALGSLVIVICDRDPAGLDQPRPQQRVGGSLG